MQKFELILKNEKEKFYDRFAIFLFLLNGIAICFFLSKLNYQKLSEGIPGLIVLLLTLLFIIISVFNINALRKKYFFHFAAAGIILYWIFLSYWWIAIIMGTLFVLYIISKKTLQVIIQTEYIIYPSFPIKKITWNVLNNVILKDDILTIDFKNNKIIQQEIDESIIVVDEKEFNEFCNQQLATSNRKQKD